MRREVYVNPTSGPWPRVRDGFYSFGAAAFTPRREHSRSKVRLEFVGFSEFFGWFALLGSMS